MHQQQKGERFCYCETEWQGAAQRFMVQCDACKKWLHGDCLQPAINEEQAKLFKKFHCQECIAIYGPSVIQTAREPGVSRQKRETRTLINYSELNHGMADDERRYAKTVLSRRFAPNKLAYVNGETVTLDWVRMTGLREPFIVEEPDGLDMTMPSSTLTVDNVADACGRDRIVEAMEVSTQADKQMTLDEWAKYFATPESERKRLLNVISLEISQSSLAPQIKRPKIVRDLDWTEKVWPSREELSEFPRVQLYCLMSVKDCFTDELKESDVVDFGGSSVFYHLLSGEKVFYFIRPTPTNLRKYEKWASSPDQSRTFLGDEVKECIEVRLFPGNTMIIPTGWIHSVYTPKDSVVIGGNFLHGLNIGTQLAVYDIEVKTKVPAKFRYPYYLQMQWYAAKYYLHVLKKRPGSLSHWEMGGIKELSAFLARQVERMEDPSLEKNERRHIRTSVPKTVTDAPTLLRQLSEQVAKVEVSLLAGALKDSILALMRNNGGSSDEEDEQNNSEQDSPMDVVKLPKITLKLPSLQPKIELPSTSEIQESASNQGEILEDDQHVAQEGDDDFGYGDDASEEGDNAPLDSSIRRKKRLKFRGVSGWVDNVKDEDYVEGRAASGAERVESEIGPRNVLINENITRPVKSSQNDVMDTSAKQGTVGNVAASDSAARNAVKKPPASVFNRLSKVMGKLKRKR
ncbi:JmjC domain-containing histone demethylation protein 1 [Blyttiomyces sp. JEL0837]|nr:JmjC domain-containing histone demethylation protein 1 [Blyttiomyces sp. JEL0837]